MERLQKSLTEVSLEVSNSLPSTIPLPTLVEPIEPSVQLPLYIPTEPTKPVEQQKGRRKEIVYSTTKYRGHSCLGVRACTQHQISNFASYVILSPNFSTFTTALTGIEILRSIEEAVADKKWKEAVLEEMGALERKHTWKVVKLSRRKTIFDCK